eukprot:scaffold454379_cov55-Attheya_sp.AAC.2
MSSSVDFSALLARHHNHHLPARVAQLVPREAWKAPPAKKKKKKAEHGGNSTTQNTQQVVYQQDYATGELHPVSPSAWNKHETDGEEEEDENAVYYIMDVPVPHHGSRARSGSFQETAMISATTTTTAKKSTDADNGAAGGSNPPTLEGLLSRSRQRDIRGDVDEMMKEDTVDVVDGWQPQQPPLLLLERRMQEREQVRARAAHALALELSRRTPLYSHHAASKTTPTLSCETTDAVVSKHIQTYLLEGDTSLEWRAALERRRARQEAKLPSILHEVEIGDWESQIQWDATTTTTTAAPPLPR